MKEFTLNHSWFSQLQLLGENGNVMGELSVGFKKRIKINGKIFKIKYNNLLSRNYKIFNENEKLVLKSDVSKNRLIYFGDETEIFIFKSVGWFNNRLDLYRKSKLIISIKPKGFFITKYKIAIDENFYNHLVVLAFVHDYIDSQRS